MGTDQLNKSESISIDDYIKPHLKKTLGLPSYATNVYLYEASENCLVAKLLTADVSEIAHIDGRFKLLRSKDDLVKKIACD